MCLQEYCDRLVRNQKLSYTDIPSAPPFVGRGLGIKQVVKQSSTFRAQDTPCLAKSSGHATTNNPKPTSNIHSGISFQDSAGYKTPDLFTGCVYMCNYLASLFIDKNYWSTVI